MSEVNLQKAWPWRQLTPSERQLGIYVYGLIFDWKAWLHRRVEQFEFVDPVTYRRQTSIDFTVPLRETPLARANDEPIFCIPVALLRKRSLRHFSLRDQDGKALPLLTQGKNGAIATGVLRAAAAQAMGKADTEIPQAIGEDLWCIAHLSSDPASKVWQHLGRHCRSEKPEEREWGEKLVGAEQFMALAADLARNFLVLTILRIEFGERRILKFDYEDESQRPKWKIAVKLARARAAWGQYRQRRREGSAAEETIRQHGGTLVTVVARSRLLDRETGELSARPVPQPNVRLIVTSGPATVEAITANDGSAAFVVPNGTGRLVTQVPPGLVEEGGVTDDLRLDGGELPLSLEYRQVSSTPENPSDPTGPPISLLQLITRSIAWRPRSYVIYAPAVGQGHSYHLEVEAPEGLAITRGKLLEAPSYPSAARGGAESQQDLQLGPAQRLHLHIQSAAQSTTAVAILHLRPRASVILRAGTISTLVSTALIWLVGADRTQLEGALGTVATLLLVVPGGLSAYISRPRENPLTSSIAFGLRVLTFASSFVALTAAATVVLSHRWDVTRAGEVRAGGEWPAAGTVLAVCFWLSLAIFAVLALTWFWTLRMPERRPGRGEEHLAIADREPR